MALDTRQARTIGDALDADEEVEALLMDVDPAAGDRSRDHLQDRDIVRHRAERLGLDPDGRTDSGLIVLTRRRLLAVAHRFRQAPEIVHAAALGECHVYWHRSKGRVIARGAVMVGFPDRRWSHAVFQLRTLFIRSRSIDASLRAIVRAAGGNVREVTEDEIRAWTKDYLGR